jgi:hypothetical protein
VFYISLLELVVEDAPIIALELVEEENEIVKYKVEEISDY